MTTHRLIFALLIVVLCFASARAGSVEASPSRAVPRGQSESSAAAYTCPTTSSNSYSQGIMYQYDNDNPVRHADHHADKNLALRGYSSVNQAKTFINYGSDDPIQPPQFATLFNPSRVPVFSTVYAANNWNWQPSPADGTRGSPITNPPVTVLGLETTPGENLRAPTHARDLGAPAGAGGSMVIFADADSLTLKFTREDSAATGYTVHIDNICTDPSLLALYNSLDNSARNTYHASRPYSYNLPGLTAGKVFGTARDTEIRVAIVDTGSFQDPRSQFEWWQIAPPPTSTPTPTPLGSVNIAPSATVSVSSQYSSAYSGPKAVDGIIGQLDNGEWASLGEMNPWIQLTWAGPQTVDRVRLYDRPNTTDWANGGTLTFSDGSSVTVPAGSLPNNGALYESTVRMVL